VEVTEPVLEARSLYRFFHAGEDEVLALRGVSLSASKGEVVAVSGPSGSGKSTLLACLAGLDEPDGGHVRVNGRMLSRRPETERAEVRARSIGTVFQSDNLVGHLDVAANLRIAQSLAGRDDPDQRARLLDVLGLASRAGSLPRQLSGGEAVRAGLAVALANDPPILVADEPTGEVDETTESEILSLLAEQAAAGLTVIMATHSDAVAAAASRVVTLVDGQVAG
jgi:putative ABC transport system ATP-binding protein